jgi:biopolymer transport protein ExbB/biopolymer transport protein TolQ
MIVLLLQSMAMAEEASSGFGWMEMWNHSGYIAKAVIVTLILMMVWSAVVGVERLLAFKKARDQSMSLAADIVAKLQARDIAGALALTKSEDYAASYLAGMLRAGLIELNDRDDAHGVVNAARAIEKAHLEEISKMKKGMTILATTGSTAPFVGLFGTTFGVINAFQGMAEAGSGLASISAGISEALVTTGVGIGVAVFGVWLFNYFTARADKVRDELAASEADFNDWAEKLLQEPTAAAGK